jgi:UDP-N-acetylmuramate--alanine ligase
VTVTPAAAGLGHPDELRTVHVVGIGGAGMSAIATALHAMGHTVTGSDLKESAVTDRLSGLGIPVAIGHRGANLGQAQLVTVSSAIGESNPEVLEARVRGLPVLAAPTARPPPPRCCRWCWSRRACTPPSSSAAT